MSEVTPIVYVVDDDASVRKALNLLVESAGWQAVTFGSAREFLSCVRTPAPGCLVLDLLLPDLNGLDVQKLVADQADMPVIFITGCGDVSAVVAAMKNGAAEYLTKPLQDDVLLDAIRNAIERSRAELRQATEMRHLRARFASLSRREQEVMALVVSGRLNKQVGGDLGISEITVKAHRGRMMRKMSAASLPDLVMMAARLRVSLHRAQPNALDIRRAPPAVPPSPAPDAFHPHMGATRRCARPEAIVFPESMLTDASSRAARCSQQPSSADVKR